MIRNLIFVLLAVWLYSTSFTVFAADQTIDDIEYLATFDLQGHRGARGLLPENTIPGFVYALEVGVTTLEMDVVINGDGHAVLSHEPWMSAKICSHADGRPVTISEAKELKLYAMIDSQVSGFDCGSRGHSDFPEQKAMSTVKPLLSDLLQKVAEHEAKSGYNQVLFNIEIKSGPDGDRIFHPEVAEFTDIVIQTLILAGTLERSTIQSFDPRALEAVHKINTNIRTVLLVRNEDGLQENLDRLSFTPTVYSPHYKLVDADLLSGAHKQGIKVIPWTVNEASIMRKLIKLGVNGLITDYPCLGVNVVAESLAMPSSRKCVGNVVELPKAARRVSSKDGTSK